MPSVTDLQRGGGFHLHFDYCRYFPDWAERSLQADSEVEADRNSYLANGYAEEFGHRAPPVYAEDVRVLDDKPSEEWEQWRGHAVATHPGYPEKPKPFEQESPVYRSELSGPPEQGEITPRGGVIVIAERVGGGRVAGRRIALRLVESAFGALLVLRSLRRGLHLGG